MRYVLFVLMFLLVCVPCLSSQDAKRATRIPVYVLHSDKDKLGVEFASALRRELSKSGKYRLGTLEAYEKVFRLYVDLKTLSLGALTEQPKTSVVSVVIEEMGLPNSFPVPSMWYHKVFVVEEGNLDELARQFLQDMDAHWCNHIKSSIGNCPTETLPPVYP